MSGEETIIVNKTRAILTQALTPRCGCAHCAATAEALDKLRELGGIVVPPDTAQVIEKALQTPAAAQEGGA